MNANARRHRVLQANGYTATRLARMHARCSGDTRLRNVSVSESVREHVLDYWAFHMALMGRMDATACRPLHPAPLLASSRSRHHATHPSPARLHPQAPSPRHHGLFSCPTGPPSATTRMLLHLLTPSLRRRHPRRPPFTLPNLTVMPASPSHSLCHRLRCALQHPRPHTATTAAAPTRALPAPPSTPPLPTSTSAALATTAAAVPPSTGNPASCHHQLSTRTRARRRGPQLGTADRVKRRDRYERNAAAGTRSTGSTGSTGCARSWWS